MVGQLTHQQQTGRVAFLGVTFMVMFTAFNSLQNITSRIYNQYGYDHLGETSILLLYFMFGVFTFVAPFIIKKLGYKKTMFLSSLGYGVFQAAGLVIALWSDMPKYLGWIIVLIGSVFCGSSASTIWVAQGSYISVVAGQKRKTQLFGLFWSLMMSSQIIGNILTTFVLGLIGNVAYFIVLTAIGFSSAFLFLLLPDIPKQSKFERIQFKWQAQKILSIIKNPKYKYLMIYFYFPGICIGFYATFLYKLIGISLPKDNNETEDDYNQRVYFYTGLTFISLGVSQAIVGILLNRFGQRLCKFKLAISGTIIIEFAGFISLLCYFFKSYPLCFGVAILWGGSQTFLQTNINAIIAELFPGQVESYSAYRIIFALGVVTTIILNIALTSSPEWIFLTIILAIQMLYTIISIKVMELKGKTSASLLQREAIRQFQE